MFRWKARQVPLLTAPVGASLQRQVYVDVCVAEETAPSYALVVSASSTELGTTLQHRVTKPLLASVFEKVLTQPRSAVSLLKTRVLEGKETGAADPQVDAAVGEWIKGWTTRPPTREQLVHWVVSRLVVGKSTDGFTLTLCGEDQDDAAAENTDKNGGGCKDLAAESEDERRPASPPPPPYSAGGGRSDRTFSDGESEFDRGNDPGDQGEAMEGEEEEVEEEEGKGEDGGELNKEVRQRTSQSDRGHTTISHSGTMATTRTSQRSMQLTRASDEDSLGVEGAPLASPSRYRFEPVSARIDSQRRHSLSSTTSNAWTEERHHFQLELTRSKRDIDLAQERQRRAEAITLLKRQQTVERSQRKLVAHEQRLRDSRFVKQDIADTLEYHDIAYRLESQLKQTKISASREQERLTQSVRVALGRSGDQWRKGPVIGSGPLSQIEIDLLTRTNRDTAPSMWVYDLHGRRHSESQAGAVAAENLFDSAMKKIQRMLDRKAADSVGLFQQYDVNRNGTLDYDEFQNLLLENGVVLTSEQARTLFRHFDPNKSGAVDYGELLWGFFNRRAFLKRWRLRKTRLSTREIKQMFYKYDRVGRGALSLMDFQLALDKIGFRVSDVEAKLLCVKFDTNKDGFIDYNEFHAFVSDDSEEFVGDQRQLARAASREYVANAKPATSKKDTGGQSKSRDNARRPSTSSTASDMDRILAELRALNETHEQIQCSLSSACR